MMALAILNAALAFACALVFAVLFRKDRSPFRAIYLAGSLVALYTAGIYIDVMLQAGATLGPEIHRPSNSLLLAILLSVGAYDFFRR